VITICATKKTPWLESASELYRPKDRSFSATSVPTFADGGCHVVRVTDPYGRILGFLDRSRYFIFQVAPQLDSRGWVDTVPDPLLLRKYGTAGNRTRKRKNTKTLSICPQNVLLSCALFLHETEIISTNSIWFWSGDVTCFLRGTN
jgi:hypothetical protein